MVNVVIGWANKASIEWQNATPFKHHVGVLIAVALFTATTFI
jgi:hypothetical protein